MKSWKRQSAKTNNVDVITKLSYQMVSRPEKDVSEQVTKNDEHANSQNNNRPRRGHLSQNRNQPGKNEPREPRQVREPREPRQPIELKEPRELKELRETKVIKKKAE